MEEYRFALEILEDLAGELAYTSRHRDPDEHHPSRNWDIELYEAEDDDLLWDEV